MRLHDVAGYAFHLAGAGVAVFSGNAFLAIALVYAGFLTMYHHKISSLLTFKKTEDQQTSIRYVVQCKGEMGWFDLEHQKYPRKTLLEYNTYKLAKKQLDTILKTRGPVESERLRIIKRTAREAVV